MDWHKDPLSLDTVIDGSYRSTQNVRRFFAAQLGAPVHFTREFRGWMKRNPGRTLGEAVARLKRGKPAAASRTIVCK